MSADKGLIHEAFPRSSRYHPDWLAASASGGANSLWLAEWLSTAMELRPGMRILDLGCGRGASSIFFHREFGTQVWATDLWFNVAENFERIQDAGVADGVFPIHADARSLPFAPGFFDAIVSIDSLPYFGTDAFYLAYLARLVKPGGRIGFAGAGLMKEFEDGVPAHLRDWWTPDLWCLHSAEWWRRHWEHTGIVDIETADPLSNGWQRWRDWIGFVAPENVIEAAALEKDRGEYLGYVRIVAHRRANVELDDPVVSIPKQYTKAPLLRS
jgi:cyclopropane fatty-acyl-phospholipid synthase-like methyltransferase